MALPVLATHAATAIGLMVMVALVIRHSVDAILRLIAGITAIVAHDKRTRAGT